jgi:ribA/ribD-fused uncharacterized protein
MRGARRGNNDKWNTPMAIKFFSASSTHSDFSNFAPYPIDLDGIEWASVEHYYQAQKFLDEAMRDEIRGFAKAGRVKRYAARYKACIRPDWSDMKDAVMDRAVRRKFERHESLRALLLSTGDEEIVEDAPNDCYWGSGRDGTGLNKLGLLLMRIRAELREAASVIPAKAGIQ